MSLVEHQNKHVAAFLEYHVSPGEQVMAAIGELATDSPGAVIVTNERLVRYSCGGLFAGERLESIGYDAISSIEGAQPGLGGRGFFLNVSLAGKSLRIRCIAGGFGFDDGGKGRMGEYVAAVSDAMRAYRNRVQDAQRPITTPALGALGLLVESPAHTSKRLPAGQKGGNAGRYSLAIVLSVSGLLWFITLAKGLIGIALGLGLLAWTMNQRRTRHPSPLAVLLNERDGVAPLAGTCVIALTFILTGAISELLARERMREVQRAEQAQRELKATADGQRADLLLALPDMIHSWREALIQAYRVSDEAPNGLKTATQLIRDVSRKTSEAAASLKEPHVELAAFREVCRTQADRPRLSKNVSDVSEYIAQGRASVKEKDFFTADAHFNAASSLLAHLESYGDGLSKHLPDGFTITAKQTEIAKLKASIPGSAAKAASLKSYEEWTRKYGAEFEELSRKKRDESVPERSETSSALERCVEKGLAYFKDVGSYPTLAMPPNTGRSADAVARERCERTTGAFGPF